MSRISEVHSTVNVIRLNYGPIPLLTTGRYDTIALGAEEARTPAEVPIGMLASLTIVMLIYMLMVNPVST